MKKEHRRHYNMLKTIQERQTMTHTSVLKRVINVIFVLFFLRKNLKYSNKHMDAIHAYKTHTRIIDFYCTPHLEPKIS